MAHVESSDPDARGRSRRESAREVHARLIAERREALEKRGELKVVPAHEPEPRVRVVSVFAVVRPDQEEVVEIAEKAGIPVVPIEDLRPLKRQRGKR